MTEKRTTTDIKRLWDRMESQGPAGIPEELADAQGEVAEVLRGLALYHEGAWPQARSSFQNVLAIDPQNPIAALYLVLALFQDGEDKEAGKLLSAIVIFPHQRWLAEFLLTFWPLRFTTSLGMPEDGPAEEEFADPFHTDYIRWQEHAERIDAAAMDDPARDGVLNDLKMVFGGLVSEKIHFQSSARRLGQRYADKATACYHAGDRLRALKLFERAHEIRPYNEMLTANLAYVYLLHRKVEESQRILAPFFDSALSRFERDKNPAGLPQADTIVCYAWSLHEAGRNDEALRLLSVVLPEGPDDWGSHFVASVCWLMKRDDVKFRHALDMALGPYFIDTWEQILRPFVERVAKWLLEGGRSGNK